MSLPLRLGVCAVRHARRAAWRPQAVGLGRPFVFPRLRMALAARITAVRRAPRRPSPPCRPEGVRGALNLVSVALWIDRLLGLMLALDGRNGALIFGSELKALFAYSRFDNPVRGYCSSTPEHPAWRDVA